MMVHVPILPVIIRQLWLQPKSQHLKKSINQTSLTTFNSYQKQCVCNENIYYLDCAKGEYENAIGSMIAEGVVSRRMAEAQSNSPSGGANQKTS